MQDMMDRKMKVVSIHSFVDVITNSSTELFVCDHQKGLESVKEILQRILDGYNLMTESSYTMDVFEEPFIFDLKEYRRLKEIDKQKRKECKKTGNWNDYYEDKSPLLSVDGWFADKDDPEEIIKDRKDYIESGNRAVMWSSHESPYYDRLQKAARKKGEWDYKLHSKEIDKIYKEIEEVEPKPTWWNEAWKYGYHNTLIDTLDGKVIIIGSSDNSIPYDIWEHINSLLNGNNYHLG